MTIYLFNKIPYLVEW